MDTIKLKKDLYPLCWSGLKYAEDTVSGDILNCKYIRASCSRFIEDLTKAEVDGSEYIFDWEYAERYLRLVQKFEHVIGNDWETKNITYLPWQNWLWMNAVGFFHRSNLKNPKYRTLHIEVPRGCSKSTMASQYSLFCIALDNKALAGSVVATFAVKNEQSRIVLDASRAMALKNQDFMKTTGTKVLAHKIVNPKTFSEMKSMSSDSKSMDGLNLRAAICDELHQMSKELFDVIVSGQKKRRDSVTVCITTAGFDVGGVGYSQSQYAKRVATGDIKDDTFFSAVYTIDDGDDIFSEDTWRKANPNYGVSVDPIGFTATAMKAKEVHSDLDNFKVKHLNVWLSSMSAYYDISKWDECADSTITEDMFLGQRCYMAVDLASRVDLTTYVKIFKKDGKYYIFPRAYIPEDTIATSQNSTLYRNCLSEGELIPVPGETIDQDRIKKDILADKIKYRVEEIMFDIWNASGLMAQLQKERLECVEFRMTVANLTEPMKTLDELIRKKAIVHRGDQISRWCVSNVVAKVDANDNVFPRKNAERFKIDIAVAIMMALAGWIQESKEKSIYDSGERGLRIL